MKIVVAGGSGFIREALVQSLLDPGDVAVRSRSPANVRAGRGIGWDAASAEVRDADVIINLAGENVGEGRWTDERKKRILDSRLSATCNLVEPMLRAPVRPRTFINASAV